MNKKEDKKVKETVKKEEPANAQKETLPAKRQILIETDGNNIEIIKAEVAGNLELMAILNTLLSSLTKK